jgi:hypothetical protein
MMWTASENEGPAMLSHAGPDAWSPGLVAAGSGWMAITPFQSVRFRVLLRGKRLTGKRLRPNRPRFWCCALIPSGVALPPLRNAIIA